MDCSFPYCRREAAPQLDMPICGPHARKVYQGVKDLLELQRAMYPHTAAKSTGTAERERNTKPGTVYFARCGDLIKIGYTTRLRQRMRDVGADEVLATMPGTINDEKALHMRFGSCWVHGEYFEPKPELVDYIAKVQQGAA